MDSPKTRGRDLGDVVCYLAKNDAKLSLAEFSEISEKGRVSLSDREKARFEKNRLPSEKEHGSWMLGIALAGQCIGVG